MPMELAFLESRTLRQELCDRTDALDKVKALVMLPDGMHVTARMVAEYFEVPESTIRALILDHRRELTSNGYRVAEGEELRCLKQLCGIRPRARSLALFSRRAVLNMAMLLRDSEVARQVRSYLLDSEERLGCFKHLSADGYPQPAPAVHRPRLRPGPHWDEWEVVNRDPVAKAMQELIDGRVPAERLDTIDRRLDAHGAVIGAMSERVCELGEEVRSTRQDVSAVRQDVAEMRQEVSALRRGTWRRRRR